MTAALPYRPDVDGLRALAVVAVVLFHYGAGGFTGGFVGVDVFFVISGYLITLLLTRPTDQPLLAQLAHFYMRRARRILPALLVVLAVCALAGAAAFFASDLMDLGRDLALCVLFLGNIAAWLGGGYFGAWLAPLRHLWSIAVEEQFYLLYPLFLFCLRTAPRLRIVVVGLLAASSFLLCVWGSYTHPVANYYWAPPRAWELLIGALGALGCWPSMRARWTRESLAALAMCVLIGCVYIYDPGTPYPGLFAFPPCIATFLLIEVGKDDATTVTRALSSKPLVFLGLISYSLYLWHAPVLAFYRYFNLSEPNALTTSLLLLVVFALAVTSWRLVEQPARARVVLASDRRFVMSAGAASVMLIAVGVVFTMSQGFPARFGRELQVLTAHYPEQSPDAYRCAMLPISEIEAGKMCRFGSDRKQAKKVVVWGDSHALALIGPYRDIAETRSIQLYVAMGAACRPLLGVASVDLGRSQQERCARFNRAVLSAIEKLQPDLLILNAFWMYPHALCCRERRFFAARPAHVIC